MRVHRIKGAIGAHGKIGEIYFRLPPKRNPPDPNGAPLKPPAVADHLGVTPSEVRQLVEHDYLKAERNGRGEILVNPRALENFVKKLEEVELVESQVPPAVESASPVTAADAPAEVHAKRRPVVAAIDADQSEPEAPLDDYDAVTPCPNCEVELGLARGVLLVECPECRHRIALEWSDEEEVRKEPEPRRNPPRRLFAFGRSARR